jgi:HEAT repeat protein
MLRAGSAKNPRPAICWSLASACLSLVLTSAAAAATLTEAQGLYEKKKYQEAVDMADRLLKEGKADPALRGMKIRALLRLGKPKDALSEYDQLVQILKHDDFPLLRELSLAFIVVMTKDMREQMRGAAYTAMKDFDSPDTIPFLEDGLSDGSGLVRALAAEGLGKLEAGRRSSRLRKALEDQAGIVKTSIIKVLAKSADRSDLPLLEAAYKDELAAVRLAAAGALYRSGRSDMWGVIQQAAGAQNPEERATALRMIGELQDPRGLPILLEALGHTQPSVRGAAASGLGELGNVRGIPALERALSDKIPAVRTSAAISLGELGVKEGIPGLKKALADPNPVVKAAVVSALLRVGEPIETVMPQLYDLAQEKDPGTRAAAAKAVGRAHGGNTGPAIEFLADMLKDPIPRPRIAAARSLGQIAETELIPILKGALHDEDDAVRATAGGAIGRILSHHSPVANHLK